VAGPTPRWTGQHRGRAVLGWMGQRRGGTGAGRGGRRAERQGIAPPRRDLHRAELADEGCGDAQHLRAVPWSQREAGEEGESRREEGEKDQRDKHGVKTKRYGRNARLENSKLNGARGRRETKR
jgi:hypothetical protein